VSVVTSTALAVDSMFMKKLQTPLKH